MHAPMKGIHAGGVGGLLSDAARLREPFVCPSGLFAVASCAPGGIDFASASESTVWRMCLKSPTGDVQSVRSRSMRLSHAPTLLNACCFAFATHSLCRPAMIATSALKFFKQYAFCIKNGPISIYGTR